MITTTYVCDHCHASFSPDTGWIKISAGLSGRMIALSKDACRGECARHLLRDEFAEFYQGGDVIIEIKTIRPQTETPRTLP